MMSALKSGALDKFKISGFRSQKKTSNSERFREQALNAQRSRSNAQRSMAEAGD
jgi:hypothetical protein